MGTIAKITAGGSTHLIASTAYGTCSTASSTVAKVATIQDSQPFTLLTGVTVHIKFTNSNSASSPTLNVNSTGAKAIMRYGTTAALNNSNNSWNNGQVVSFTYDGTYWQMNDFGVKDSGTFIYSSNSSDPDFVDTKYSRLYLDELATAETDFYIKLDSDLLWTNSSVTSNFAAQTVSLDLSGYSYVHVLFAASTNDGASMVSVLALIDSLKYKAIADGNSLRYRFFTPSATGVVFEAGMAYSSYGGSAATANGYVIPYKIYGIR